MKSYLTSLFKPLFKKVERYQKIIGKNVEAWASLDITLLPTGRENW